MERCGSIETICNLRQMVIAFKQEEEERLVKAWERFRGIAFGMEHGLRDWMLVHVFYKGLSDTSRTFLDDECESAFMNTNTTNALLLLDSLLVEVKIKKSFEKAKVSEEDFDDLHEIFKLYNREKEIEEVKMLSEVKDPLLDLEKCILHELMSIL
jgi:hypothetical protein